MGNSDYYEAYTASSCAACVLLFKSVGSCLMYWGKWRNFSVFCFMQHLFEVCFCSRCLQLPAMFQSGLFRCRIVISQWDPNKVVKWHNCTKRKTKLNSEYWICSFAQHWMYRIEMPLHANSKFKFSNHWNYLASQSVRWRKHMKLLNITQSYGQILIESQPKGLVVVLIYLIH